MTQQIIEQIGHLNMQELVAVAEAVNMRRTYLSRMAIRQTFVGDRVWFVHSGARIEGEVKRTNRKTVTVMATNGRLWRVPGSMLNRVTA